MATYGCSHVVFYDICMNAFYFDIDPETDVHEDAFHISSQCSKCLIQSKDNKFLLLHEGKFQAEHLTTTETVSFSGCKFNIQRYKNNDLGENKGRAVILYATKDGKKMVACCNDKDEIYPVAMDLPQNIVESSHKAVFYLTELPASNKYLFESSTYRHKFVGFQPNKDKPSLSKLVLQYKGDDEVVDFCEVTVIE